MKKVFVDLDGVLADFDKEWVRLFGYHPSESFNKENWTRFVDRDSFFSLDLLFGAELLIETLIEVDEQPGVSVYILGSTGGYEMHGVVQEQKLRWLAKHKIPFQPIFVPGKRYKQWHATANSALIDDHPKNIEQFKERNGVGILHTDVSKTLQQLKQFL